MKEPSDIVEILKHLPKDILSRSPLLSTYIFLRVWLCVLLGILLVHHAPPLLLPFAWLFLGTSASGLFFIAHECGHQSFSASNVLNEVIGSLCLAPLFFPYNCWKFSHNEHHAYTNHMEVDVAWRPLMRDELSKLSPLLRFLLIHFHKTYFFLGFSVYHLLHFLFPLYVEEEEELRIAFWRSIIVAVLGGTVTLLTLSYFGPLWKLYFVPLLIFWFWLSVFTYFQHRHPKTPWKTDDKWTKTYGSLFATVHVKYPRWVEVLTLYVNYHIPHHVSARIAWFNLERASKVLFDVYGDNLIKEEFGWRLWKKATTTECVFFQETVTATF